MAYYNMLVWWRQRPEHEQSQWCNVVNANRPITLEMAEIVGSNRSGTTPGGAWLIPIRDPSAPATASGQIWIMSRRFEAFIREQCSYDFARLSQPVSPPESGPRRDASETIRATAAG